MLPTASTFTRALRRLDVRDRDRLGAVIRGARGEDVWIRQAAVDRQADLHVRRVDRGDVRAGDVPRDRPGRVAVPRDGRVRRRDEERPRRRRQEQGGVGGVHTATAVTGREAEVERERRCVGAGEADVVGRRQELREAVPDRDRTPAARSGRRACARVGVRVVVDDLLQIGQDPRRVRRDVVLARRVVEERVRLGDRAPTSGTSRTAGRWSSCC